MTTFAAKPTGICPCTDLTRDQIVTQIRAKNLKSSKEVRHVLDFKDKDGCPKCRPAINYYLNMVYPFEHRDEKILASLMKDIMQIYKMMVLSQ